MRLILLAATFLVAPAVFALESKPDKNFEEGMKSYDAGAFRAAEKSFRNALMTDGKNDRARFQLAATLLAEQKLAEALKQLKSIKTDESVMEMVPIMQGDILLRQSKWADALASWEKVPDRNADLKSLRSQGMARAYEGLNKPSDAANAWVDHLTLQVKPANETFERVAVNRLKAKEKDKALAYCEKAEFLQKEEAYKEICKAHVYRAGFTVNSDKGDQLKAVAALEQALKKDKNNFDAQLLLAEWKK